MLISIYKTDRFGGLFETMMNLFVLYILGLILSIILLPTQLGIMPKVVHECGRARSL